MYWYYCVIVLELSIRITDLIESLNALIHCVVGLDLSIRIPDLYASGWVEVGWRLGGGWVEVGWRLGGG